MASIAASPHFITTSRRPVDQAILQCLLYHHSQDRVGQ